MDRLRETAQRKIDGQHVIAAQGVDDDASSSRDAGDGDMYGVGIHLRGAVASLQPVVGIEDSHVGAADRNSQGVVRVAVDIRYL